MTFLESISCFDRKSQSFLFRLKFLTKKLIFSHKKWQFYQLLSVLQSGLLLESFYHSLHQKDQTEGKIFKIEKFSREFSMSNNFSYFYSRIVQCVLMLTAATCWLLWVFLLLFSLIWEFIWPFFISSWLCCYMAQMNPLIGPKLHQNTILIMAREWGNEIVD